MNQYRCIKCNRGVATEVCGDQEVCPDCLAVENERLGGINVGLQVASQLLRNERDALVAEVERLRAALAAIQGG